MSRKHSMNQMLLRKQLLITEAELHREQICQDFRIIANAFEGFGRKAKSVGAAVSIISVLAGGFAALRGVRKSSHNGGHRSLVSQLFSGVRFASTLMRGWNSIKHARHSND